MIKTTHIYTATYDVFCEHQKIDRVINKTVHAANKNEAVQKIERLYDQYDTIYPQNIEIKN